MTRVIAGIWQSPVQRAGWKRVRLEALTCLKRECALRGFDLPARATFDLSRRRIEELRYHRAVDIMAHDAKRHDDAKPRIRRDNSRFAPMEQIVMDVKPLDCVVARPDGSHAYPKLIGFFDSGTHRLFGRIILLPPGEGVRQEHVTDAFLDMVQSPDWGFPQQLYFDNGSEYKHFYLIRDAIKLISDLNNRVIIHAKPYSGASKPIESKFAVLDRHITSQMGGYTGSDRMDKKIHRMGKAAKPYNGSIEEFEREFFERLADLHAMPIGSGPFRGRSPLEIYHDHLDQGWRPVAVHRLALDCAFAKQLGPRKVDRGVITIGQQRYRHEQLAQFAGRRVPVVKPYRRSAWPLANLPEVGWVALEPEMLCLPGDVGGAQDAGRLQKQHNQAVRRLKSRALPFDPTNNVRERVAALPTRAAPAPMIDVMMSPRRSASRAHGSRRNASGANSQLRSNVASLASWNGSNVRRGRMQAVRRDDSAHPFVETTVARLMLALMRKTHERCGITVISGPWGIGKTTAIDAFAREIESERVVMKVEPGATKRGATGGNVLQLVLQALRDSQAINRHYIGNATWTLKQQIGSLLSEQFGHYPDEHGISQPMFTFIFDEAQYLSREAIEMLRFWNDRDRTTTPFRVGLVFVGNNEFALAESPGGESVLLGAVRSRLLFEEQLDYAHVSDMDLTLFCQSRGIGDAGAIAELISYFGKPRVKRDLRTAEGPLSMVNLSADGRPVTADLVRSIIVF
jgi:hypothetical protein